MKNESEITPGYYWVKFNGKWIVAEFFSNVGSRQSYPKGEWRIDGELYVMGRMDGVKPGRLIDPKEEGELRECIIEQAGIISILKRDEYEFKKSFFYKMYKFFKQYIYGTST